MMDFKSLRTIRNDEEYQAALKAIRPYFADEPDPGTPEAENFDALFVLIEAYEAQHHPIPTASPIAVIRHVMQANNYSQTDLANLLGSKARASELLSGKREINLDQIRKLSRGWRIPAAALIGDVEAA